VMPKRCGKKDSENCIYYQANMRTLETGSSDTAHPRSAPKKLLTPAHLTR